MAAVRQGLGYRLVWSGFATLLCADALHGVFSGAGLSHLVTAVAWALFAAAWFMQPLVLAASISSALRQSAALAIGAPKLRARLGYAALGLLVGGLLVRVTSGA